MTQRRPASLQSLSVLLTCLGLELGGELRTGLAGEAAQAIAPAHDADEARRAAAARAQATQANLEGWEMGPFVKHPKPVLKPNPNSVFKCPIGR